MIGLDHEQDDQLSVFFSDLLYRSRWPLCFDCLCKYMHLWQDSEIYHSVCTMDTTISPNSKQSTENGKEKRGKSWRAVLGVSHRAKAIFSSTEPIPQRLKSERLTKLIHNAKLLHSVIQHKAPAGSNLDQISGNSISKQPWDINAVSGRIILTGNEGSFSL